jgi:TPR repeat protein
MSVPIYDYAEANNMLAAQDMEVYYPCCSKTICGGCVYSFSKSVNGEKCPFCKAQTLGKTDEEEVKEQMKRVEANDAGAIYTLGNCYFHGQLGLLQDRNKAIELWKQATKLGSSEAHFALGCIYDEEGDSKKEKFHYEAAAMAGHDSARYNLGYLEEQSGNMERAVRHFRIGASAGYYKAMDNLLIAFNKGLVSRNAIDSALTAYNISCAEMRSEARDAYIRFEMRRIERNNA